MAVIALAFLAFGVVALLWWLLVTTEGVYLGRGVVVWLYDLYADRYDDIKVFQPVYEQMLLAQPMMNYIAPHTAPLVLDVATGTGRLPIALLDHTVFQGRVIALDLSYKMLRKAAEKLDDDRVFWLRGPAEALPFDDDAFDVVTCLESLEFMMHPAEVLREMVRVLRPGGLLLVTNRVGKHFMPGKTFTEDQLREVLSSAGLHDVEIEIWQVDYKRVWGLKAGDSFPAGPRHLVEVLRCPACGGGFIIQDDHTWRCVSCHQVLTATPEGIFDLYPLTEGHYNAAP